MLPSVRLTSRYCNQDRVKGLTKKYFKDIDNCMLTTRKKGGWGEGTGVINSDGRILGL